MLVRFKTLISRLTSHENFIVLFVQEIIESKFYSWWEITNAYFRVNCHLNAIQVPKKHAVKSFIQPD